MVRRRPTLSISTCAGRKIHPYGTPHSSSSCSHCRSVSEQQSQYHSAVANIAKDVGETGLRRRKRDSTPLCCRPGGVDNYEMHGTGCGWSHSRSLQIQISGGARSLHPRSKSDESEFERSRGVPPGVRPARGCGEGWRVVGREVDARVYFLVCRLPVSTG